MSPRPTPIPDEPGALAASRRLLAAGERDLQQIVLDLHDGPVQDLFAALTQLQILQRQVADDPNAERRLLQVASLLERALGDMRMFIGAFRPPGFERRTLGAVLEGLAVQHEALTDQAVDFTVASDLGDCGLATKIALYRIMQESLANGHRHSGATLQQVTLERRGLAFILTVTDNGRGFDPELVLAREADVGVEGGHFGLRGMQDRIETLGGTFGVQSEIGRGTTLRVTLPAV
jgi:signal transduction histidine kinase